MVDLLEGPAVLEDHRHAGGATAVAFLADKHAPNIAIFGACVTRVTELIFGGVDYQLVTKRACGGCQSQEDFYGYPRLMLPLSKH